MMRGKQNEVGEIMEVRQGELVFRVLGTTPLLMNSMSAKSRHNLLYPQSRKTAADRAGTLKHDPYEEFFGSAYRFRTDDQPTRLYLRGIMFKGAIASAASKLPGVFKTTVSQLVHVVEYDLPVFGVPQLHMDIERMADQKRTPDLRTRCVIPQWACEITVMFAMPLLNEKQVLNLAAFGGRFIGVGDRRNEKGKSSFGCFELVGEDDKRWNAIVNNAGREVQDAALANPAFFDYETENLYTWFDAEKKQRLSHPIGETKRKIKPASKPSNGTGVIDNAN